MIFLFLFFGTKNVTWLFLFNIFQSAVCGRWVGLALKNHDILPKLRLECHRAAVKPCGFGAFEQDPFCDLTTQKSYKFWHADVGVGRKVSGEKYLMKAVQEKLPFLNLMVCIFAQCLIFSLWKISEHTTKCTLNKPIMWNLITYWK